MSFTEQLAQRDARVREVLSDLHSAHLSTPFAHTEEPLLWCGCGCDRVVECPADPGINLGTKRDGTPDIWLRSCAVIHAELLAEDDPVEAARISALIDAQFPHPVQTAREARYNNPPRRRS